MLVYQYVRPEPPWAQVFTIASFYTSYTNPRLNDASGSVLRLFDVDCFLQYSNEDL